MSTDAKVTKHVMQTLADGRDGFAKAAEKLDESSAPELATKFRHYSNQRAEYYRELETMALRYGDDIEDGGSVAAALHRGWMAVKDSLAGSDPKGVLDAAERGEDHAVTIFRDALDESDVSGELRNVLERQSAGVQAVHEAVRSLRSSHQ